MAWEARSRRAMVSSICFRSAGSDLDEVRPEPGFQAARGQLADHGGRLRLLAIARQVKLEPDHGSQRRRLEAADEDTVASQLARGGLHRRRRSGEADGKHDRNAAHVLCIITQSSVAAERRGCGSRDCAVGGNEAQPRFPLTLARAPAAD